MLAGRALQIVLDNRETFINTSLPTPDIFPCLSVVLAAFSVEYLVSLAKSLPRCFVVFAAIESGILA